MTVLADTEDNDAKCHNERDYLPEIVALRHAAKHLPVRVGTMQVGKSTGECRKGVVEYPADHYGISNGTRQ